MGTKRRDAGWGIGSAAFPPSRCSLLAVSCMALASGVYWSLIPTRSQESLNRLRLENADKPYPHARVVFSMTSFPGRLERVRDTMHSLATQSRPVDAIILSIPHTVDRIHVPTQLPPIVAELQKEYGELLHIHRTTDYGPSTKLLGALEVEQDPKTIIITVDDDTVYHKDLALALVDGIEHAKDSAVCFVCEFWPQWWYKPLYMRAEGDCMGFQNAYAGTAYRRGFFDKGIFDYTGAPDGCRLHDDVWISGYLSRKGIKRHVIKPGFWSIVGEMGHTNMSIHEVKDTESKYRDPCLEYFGWLREA
mmetsp:Transcript_2488/g.6008  ORF Transcript_2488/g.6008 Transcript_2488/m.6008 type:complete len:305 (+) Transcript_2488:268-1182(+)